MGNRELEGGFRGEELPCGPHYFPAVNFARTFSHPSAVDWREIMLCSGSRKTTAFSFGAAVLHREHERANTYEETLKNHSSFKFWVAAFGGRWEIVLFYFLLLT